jgi:hypothetical protein
MATNHPKDNATKSVYLDRYGVVEGLSRLAREFPFVSDSI